MSEHERVEARVRLRQDAVTWRLVGQEVVALDVRNSSYIAINPSGSVVWQALGVGATTAELVAAVRAKFDVDQEQAARDVQLFLSDLTARDLLEVLEEAA